MQGYGPEALHCCANGSSIDTDLLCCVPCMQGYGPEAVTMLLEAGADPFRCNVQGLSAIAMTANQVCNRSTRESTSLAASWHCSTNCNDCILTTHSMHMCPASSTQAGAASPVIQKLVDMIYVYAADIALRHWHAG
jgi:hypothetical protein